MSRTILSLCLALTFYVLPAFAGPLHVGVAVIDITPPVPYRMAGYFMERLSTGVNDPLQAKAIVLQQDGVRAALVFCDLIGISPQVSAKARREASRVTTIPIENIMIAATHSHTAPLYFGALRDHLHQRSVERLGADPYETVDYPERLVEKIVAAVVGAYTAQQPAELAAGYAIENRLSFNRRFHMKDGSVRFNPGQLNPDIVRAAGPIDPQVGVVSLKRPGAEQPFAALAAFALHLDTVSGTEYSADYAKHLEDRLRESFGGEFVSLFGAGTCGDINHVDVTSKTVRKAPEIGKLLGDTVAATIEQGALAPIATPKLAVRSVNVEAPLQSFSASEVAAARKNMDLIGGRGLSFLDQVQAYSIVSRQLYPGEAVSLEIQAFRLSDDVAIVALPGEVFSELGLAIKAASPFKTTIVIELANDSLGYLPTKRAFAEGSYETVNSRIAPGGGEMMADAAIKLLKELR